VDPERCRYRSSGPTPKGQRPARGLEALPSVRSFSPCSTRSGAKLSNCPRRSDVVKHGPFWAASQQSSRPRLAATEARASLALRTLLGRKWSHDIRRALAIASTEYQGAHARSWPSEDQANARPAGSQRAAGERPSRLAGRRASRRGAPGAEGCSAVCLGVALDVATRHNQRRVAGPKAPRGPREEHRVLQGSRDTPQRR